MSEARHNFLVGLFVLMGLGALGMLIVLFGQGPEWLMGRDSYELNIWFESASGIRPGTLVTVAGNEIGRVKRVDFINDQNLSKGVQVVVAIENRFVLPQDSTAETFEAGLLAGGRPPIQITPGPAGQPPLKPGEIIRGNVRGAVETLFPMSVVTTFDEAGLQIRDAARALTPVLQDLHEIMQPRSVAAVDQPGGPPGNLATAMARIDVTLRNVNEVIGDPAVKENLKESIVNLRAITDDGRVMIGDVKAAAKDARQVVADTRALVGDARVSLKKVDSQVDRVARKSTDLLDRVSRFVDEFYLVAQRMNRGEGTVGKLLVDPKLYEAMVLTFQRLTRTTDEFRQLLKDWQEHGLKTRL